MVAVDRNIKRVVEIEDQDRPVVCVEDGVGFRAAGDQNPPAALGGGHAGVGFGEVGHCGN